jgi:hypothetical protein
VITEIDPGGERGRDPAVIHVVGRFWGFVGDTLGLAGPRALCGAWLSYRAPVPDLEPPPGTPTCPGCVSKLGHDPAGGS